MGKRGRWERQDVVVQTLEYGAMSLTARSRHTGGVVATMCDGSVRFVTNSVDIGTWQALSTMADGEVMGEY